MKFASEVLVKEHEGILFAIDILEQIAKAVEETGKADTKDIDGMVYFLRLFADKCHHGKEEGLLFPAMEIVGIPNERGPIGQMLIEHVQGRQYIAEMAASTEGGTLQVSRFVEAATGYVTLLRAHIEKENKILFPAGDRLLPADTQQQLLQQFDEFEQTVMGKGVHDELHAMLDRFEEEYLK